MANGKPGICCRLPRKTNPSKECVTWNRVASSEPVVVVKHYAVFGQPRYIETRRRKIAQIAHAYNIESQISLKGGKGLAQSMHKSH